MHDKPILCRTKRLDSVRVEDSSPFNASHIMLDYVRHTFTLLQGPSGMGGSPSNLLTSVSPAPPGDNSQQMVPEKPSDEKHDILDAGL